MGIKRVAGLNWNRPLMAVKIVLERARLVWLDKFGSIVDKMCMKLGSKFLSCLKIKTQLLKRLQCVIVVDGAPHSHKDCVEGN